jgi:hypothetical protein
MCLDIPLKQEISESIPGLLEELGLHVVEDQYFPTSFGNSDVTLQSSRLLVRFVRDRGQVWAEVAPPTAPTSWWPLGFVLEAMQGRRPEIQFDLPTAALLLRENFRELVEALGPRLSETRREIEKRSEERLKALMGPRKASGS